MNDKPTTAPRTPTKGERGYIRVVTPGEKSDLLVQEVFDASKVEPRRTEIPWHSSKTK